MITPVIKPIIIFITGIIIGIIIILTMTIISIGPIAWEIMNNSIITPKMKPITAEIIATNFPNDIALIFVIVTVDIFISNPEISIKITTLDKKIVIVTHLVVNTKLTINKSIKFL